MDGSMRNFRRRCAALIAGLVIPFGVGLFGLIPPALAQKVYAPKPWEIGMQASGGPLKTQEIWLHDIVLVIITVITLFVGGLLAWVIYRYNAERNPIPSRLSHNTVVEVLWTVIPILILVVMAIPSFQLVYYEDRTQDADLTVKVTGHQWYWEYTYPDKGNIDFSSYIIPDDQLKPGQLRLLTVDNDLVVPAGKNIRVLETSGDVIHSWFVPSLGVQRYAIPGRTIETWFRADQPGIYVGECNQICGTNHSRMPIVVRAVTPQEFDAWLVQAKTKFAEAGNKVTASAVPPAATTQSATTQVATTPAGTTQVATTQAGSTQSATTGLDGLTKTGMTLVKATGNKPFSLLAAAQVQR
jgi:cytochrome c oxidase subunit 2